MQQQTKRFSFRKTFRNAFHASEKDKQSIPDACDPISSESIGRGSDLAMGAIETSLAALQTGSALATHVPFVSPIAGLILQALKMRGEVKQCKEEWDAVMDKLSRSANIVIGVGKLCQARGLAEEDLPDGLRTILKSLHSDLDGIEGALKLCTEASTVKRVLLRTDMLQKVKKYDAKLSNVLQNFQNELLLDVRFAQIVDKREVVAVTQADATISTPFRQGPTTPQIFFGRDAELAQIVHVITTNVGSRPARIAILGPGGYGKTTLAHAVLTVDVIREHFGDTRYFVPCESVTSSGALLTELGKTLGVVNSGSDALWTRIHVALTAKASIICFDNFESPWDQHVEMKHSVEELLSKVTELHRVTVLITMRGAERPARTQWTQPFLKPLETLDHNAAKEIWQAIAGNYDEFSERLIEAVDHVPLAINILSHLSQVMPPALLWKEWNSKQTRAVQTGQEHRLSNLEYSIQLSINSGRMKANLSAKNLLGVLCILPDGLHLRHLDKFDEMLVGLDITSCLQTLLQCSLIKLNEKRYQLHPIVQHVCLNQGMLLSKHKAALENFYTTLALSDFKRVSSETFEEMMLEVNNTKAALLSLLNSNYANESRLVAASIKFTSFCGSIGDHSDKVISQAIEFVQMNSGEWLLLIQCLHQLGEIYCYGSNFEKAKEKLQEAEKLCILNTHAHSPIYGHILKNMGDTYLLQDELNDAEACYQKALSIWKDRNDIYMQGVIYSNLGNLYRRLQRLDEAITLYQSAIQCHESTNNPLTQGTNYKGLGWIYLLQSKLVEAEDAVQKALKLHEETNAFLNQGNDYQLLGSIYLRLKRLKDATAACQKAIELYKLANNALGQGNVYKILGEIHLFQGKTNDAEESFKKALELHTMANNCLGQGGDHSFLGHIYKQRGQLYDAKAMFEKAIALNKKAQASVSEKKNIEHLNAVITQMKDSSVV